MVEGLVIFLDVRTKAKFVVLADDEVDALTKVANFPKEYLMTYQEGNARKSTGKWTIEQLKTKQVVHDVYFVEGLEGFECNSECSHA